MSIANFKPTIWSQRLRDNLDKALVLGALANRFYEEDAQRAGGQVRINRPGQIVVSNYSGTVNYQTPTSDQLVLNINQRAYFGFAVDDVDKVQANIDLVEAYAQRAGYSMADHVDRFIAGLFTDAQAGDVTLNITGTINAGDIINAFTQAALLLDNANVPSQGRWAVISPALHAAIPKDARILQATQMGDDINRLGQNAVGQLGGFTLYKSNNLLGTGVTVTLTANANAGATTIACSALSAAIPAGAILTFGAGKYARVAATANAGATSITVNALQAPLTSGDVATYVRVRKCLFGVSDAITLAFDLETQVEALRDKDAFSDFVRANQNFGALVVEPLALGTLTVTEA
jgi:hypothetical protein